MHLFSEATLLRLETFCTQHREELKAAPSLVTVWFYPTLLLKSNEAYKRESYLYAAVLSTVAVTLLFCAIQCSVLAVGLLIVPHLWSTIFDPKRHAQLIGLLSQEGFYYLPFIPLIWLMASLTFNWPRYFFWNKRAKRLQQEGPVLVSIVAAVVPDDVTVWPPAPRPPEQLGH